MDPRTRRSLELIGATSLAAYALAVVWLYRHPSAGESLHASLIAAWRWLMAPPPLWARDLLGRFLRVLVPVLLAVSAALALIMRLQAATPLQRSLWRFLAVKAVFWSVFWLALYARETILWLALDFLTLSAVLLTAVELGARLIDRYVIARRSGSSAPEGGMV